ncbi:MAG: hypothetical protein ACTHMB_02310 [Candidatus Binatia bacterium]
MGEKPDAADGRNIVGELKRRRFVISHYLFYDAVEIFFVLGGEIFRLGGAVVRNRSADQAARSRFLCAVAVEHRAAYK